MTDAGDITRDRYAQLVIAKLKELGTTEAWYVPEEFQVGYFNDTGDIALNLAPTYQEFRGGDAAERETILNRLIGAATDLGGVPESWEEAAPLLLPVIRPASYSLEMEPLSRPALPYLREFVVVDRPTTMAYVGPRQVDRWGVDPDIIFATARANLAQTPGAERTHGLEDRQFSVVKAPGDDYLSSYPLLDRWLAGFTANPDGLHPVIAIPDPATLFVAPDVPELIPDLLERVEAAFNDAARSISPQVYTIDDTGAVVPYPVHDGHPAAEAVRRADSILAFHTYHGQKEWLEERYQNEGEDIFVASLLGMDTDDGSFGTVATWTDGIRTLLPRADLVAFQPQDPDAKPFMVTWGDATELVHLTPAPDLDPPRYEVSDWPDRTTVARLRIRAKHR